jgi:biopolymer transport protein ExbB/TolQ
MANDPLVWRVDVLHDQGRRANYTEPMQAAEQAYTATETAVVARALGLFSSFARLRGRTRRLKCPSTVKRLQAKYDALRGVWIGEGQAVIYHAGAKELCFHLAGSSVVDSTLAARLASARSISETGMNSVRTAMERAVGEESLKLESNLILLATAVSGAPFLGLLGTVWGVMDAFSGIAMAGQASLAAMAPGVSGALITTVVGLLVAIPAMFGFNFLTTSIRSQNIQMENFAAECAAVFEHRFTPRS